MNKSAILFILSAAVGVAMMGLGIIWPLIPVYAVELGAGGFLVFITGSFLILLGGVVVTVFLWDYDNS